MKRTSALLVVVSFAIFSAAATAADAAVPFTVGFGFGHDLAVGGDGNGHLVWLSDDEPADRVHYCRVPAGGSACDAASRVLDFPGPDLNAFSTGDDAQVFAPAAGKVVILASCFSCGPGSEDPAGRSTFRWISNNNGVDFAGPVLIGDLTLTGQAGYLDSGDVALGVESGRFQGMPAGGGDPVELGGDPLSVYSPAIGPVPGTDRLVHALANLDEVKYAVFDDPGAAPILPAELNDAANWAPGKLLSAAEGDNDETHLSAGPNGAFLSYRFFVPNDSRVGLRKFDPATNTFGPPSYAEGADPIDNESLQDPNHSQDGAGRLHVVWASLYDGGRLRYSRSDDGGAGFSAAATLAAKERFIEPIVETAGGGGFAAWKDVGDSNIRMVVLDPIAESAAGPPEITGFGIDDATLTPGQQATFSFNSSEAGNAVLSFEKKVKGLKLKQKGKKKPACKPWTKKRFRKLRRSLALKFSGKKLAKKLKKRRCRTWQKIGEIKQAVVPGQNTIVFNGKIAGRNLGPGRYRAKLVVTDLAGNPSQTETIEFRVVGKRKG